MTPTAGQGRVIWRAMTTADLPEIKAVAAAVHPDYPEDEAVFAERAALYPAGCHALADGEGVAGYVLSHPWRQGEFPALNVLLGEIPADASVYYIHDLALLPRARGSGAASDIVSRLTGHARAAGFATMALVAVSRSAGFWQRHGFRVTHDASLDRKLASYDDAARYMTRELNS